MNYNGAVKRALYARDGIPEFWIVNLAGNEVEVCCQPSGGEDTSISHVGREAVLEPGLLPGVANSVAAFLG